MRHSSFCALLTALLCALPLAATAQTRVAPPAAVESSPLAPPAGSATPVQNAPSGQAPSTQPPAQSEPQPVQPPPAPQGQVVPQPVQPAPQAPVEPQPVQPPPTLPPPSTTPPTQQQTGAPNPNATLAGRPGDPSDVDEIALVARPVLALSGQASWDQGFQRLSESFALLRGEAGKAGLAVAGRPLTLFVETDDNGFKFTAMLPVASGTSVQGLTNGVSLSQSPAGRSLRFVHTAPYDDIDSTYETITAYLEAKNIQVKDAFLEEYVSELKDPADPNLEINVYVQPK